MKTTFSEIEAQFVDLSSEIRSVIEWLESRAHELSAHPLADWKRRLDNHRRQWDACLRARRLMPKHPDADAELASRTFERIVATFADDDSEEQWAATLAERLRSLTGHAEGTRDRLAMQKGTDEEIKVLEELFVTGQAMLKSLEVGPRETGRD